MNPQIIQALLKAAGQNPKQIIDVLQGILDVLKANPDLLNVLIQQFARRP